MERKAYEVVVEECKFYYKHIGEFLQTSEMEDSESKWILPTQELVVRDLHENTWTFGHIYRGAHTLGQAQCATFKERLYSNSSNIDAGFSNTRKRRCPFNGGDTTLAPLDQVTPNSFDNNYYRNLMQKKGLLATDQVLFGTGGSTDSIVSEYSRNPSRFASDFAAAMIKMGDIVTLNGSDGQIRRICSAVN